MYGYDNHDLLWDGVSGEHELAQKHASLTHSKVAVAKYWPFLSRATNTRDFENRLSLTLDRIAGLVPAETLEDVLTSLRDDFKAVAGKGENPFAKDDDKDNDEADDDDKDSKDSDDDDDSDDDKDSDDSKSDDDSDDDSDDKDDSKSDDDSDDSDDDEDNKPDFLKDKKTAAYHEQYGKVSKPQLAAYRKHNVPPALHDELAGYFGSENHDAITNYVKQRGERHGRIDYGDVYRDQPSASGHLRELEEGGGGWGHFGAKEATNYQPDPNAAWRYHPGYDQLRAPVNNGDLQDGDGFPVDLAQGEDRASERIQFQLTPGPWSQHDGMPERPMPQGQQRGYMPVNSSLRFDAQGFVVAAGMDFRKMVDGSTDIERPLDPYYNEIPEIRGTSRTKGTFAGPTARDLADMEKQRTHLRSSASLFDADGFVVNASEGRGVDQLQDPVPGDPQRHNQFYFQEGSGVGGNAGFPVDPSAEPLLNNMDEFYGDVAPQQSSGSNQGQVDTDGYSRLGNRRTAGWPGDAFDGGPFNTGPQHYDDDPNGDRNVWGTPKHLINADEYCPDCEHAVGGHYTNCSRHPHNIAGRAQASRRTAAGAVNYPEPTPGSKQACSQCGGDGYIDASQWGEPRGTMHPCYRCGATGQEDAHGEWEQHEYNRGYDHGEVGIAPEEGANEHYLQGHGKAHEENKFSHYPEHYRVKRDGQEDYHSPAAQDHYRAMDEYGGGDDPRFPYRQASFDAQGFLVESPNFT